MIHRNWHLVPLLATALFASSQSHAQAATKVAASATTESTNRLVSDRTTTGVGSTLFTNAEHRFVLTNSDKNSHVHRRTQVTANLDYLIGETGDGSDGVVMELFPDVRVVAKKTRFERRSAMNYAWFGTLGADADTVVLSVVDGKLAGTIFDDGVMYRVRGLGGGIYEVAEVDQSGFQELGKDFVRPEAGPWSPGHLKPDLSGPSTIDIAVVYTNNAGLVVADMEAEIQHAVDLTNAAFMHSHIDVYLQLKTTHNTWYTTTGGDFFTDLTRLQSKTDGYLDFVHDLRDQPSVRADIVTLVVDAGPEGHCGLGYQNDEPWLRREENGFNVVNVRCMVDSLTLAHEVGHNLGAGHDWVEDVTPGSNHGKIMPLNQRRTIMAYWTSCPEFDFDCPKYLNFSNPYVFINGEATGNPLTHAEPADNHEEINANRGYVSLFR